MSKKKVVFDLGSTNISVFCDNTLLLRIPTVIIIKRSLHPFILFYGKEAVEKQFEITEEEMFVKPVCNGVITHYEGVKLLIKEVLHSLFGLNTSIEICVLVSCGLEIEQKRDIERVFVTSGYTNVYLLESILALSPIAEKFGICVGCIIGGDMVEFGIFKDKKIISGYSLDMGSHNINKKIMELILDTYKLHISEQEAENIKLKVGSLFAKDVSNYAFSGKDILSGKSKKISISNREIYQAIVYVFTRIIKLIDGALIVAPNFCLEDILSKGMIVAGGGAEITGLEEYVYKNLNLPIIVEDKPFLTHLKGAYLLISDENFVNNFFGEK